MSIRQLFALTIVTGAISLTPTAVAQDAVLRSSVDAARSEIIVTLGPLTIPAGDHGAIEQPKIQAITVPIDAYIHAFHFDLVDEQERELPSVLIHHVNIIAPQRRELFSQIMQRVAAAGAETGSLSLPRLFGYPVSKGDSLVVSAMLHNPTGVSYEDITLRIRMKYSSLGSLMPTIAIQPFYLDVMPPAGVHAFSLPPGRSSKSWEGRPAIPGRILGVGGHMHKYGVSLRFEDVTRGKVLWEANPVVDSLGNVIAMPRKFFFWQLGVQLDPTHTYRLTAEYDNPTGETIDGGAMGTLGGIFVPDERAAWPALEPDHPEYLADRDVTYARNHGAESHHHNH